MTPTVLINGIQCVGKLTNNNCMKLRPATDDEQNAHPLIPDEITFIPSDDNRFQPLLADGMIPASLYYFNGSSSPRVLVLNIETNAFELVGVSL
jgi:hypothetical protein